MKFHASFPGCTRLAQGISAMPVCCSWRGGRSCQQDPRKTGITWVGLFPQWFLSPLLLFHHQESGPKSPLAVPSPFSFPALVQVLPSCPGWAWIWQSFWHYRCMPSCLGSRTKYLWCCEQCFWGCLCICFNFLVLGRSLRPLNMLGECFTAELCLASIFFFFCYSCCIRDWAYYLALAT